MHKTTTDAGVTITTHKQDCELKLSRHQTTTDVDAKIAVATQKKENNSKEEIIEIESFDPPDTCCGGNENLNPANGHDDRHSSSGGKTLLAFQDKFDLVDTRSDEDSSDVDRQSRNRSAGHLALLGNGQSSSSPVQRASIRMNLETKSCVSPSRSTSFPVAFSPMTSSTSSQPISPAIRKMKDQKSSDHTSALSKQDSASLMAPTFSPLRSKGGVFSTQNTSSSIVTHTRLNDVEHFTFDDELPIISGNGGKEMKFDLFNVNGGKEMKFDLFNVNGGKEMKFDLFSDHPICSPIVRMPLKKRLLARKEEDVLTGRG